MLDYFYVLLKGALYRESGRISARRYTFYRHKPRCVWEFLLGHTIVCEAVYARNFEPFRLRIRSGAREKNESLHFVLASYISPYRMARSGKSSLFGGSGWLLLRKIQFAII